MNICEVKRLNWILGVGGDIKIEEEPAREDPDGEDVVEHVPVDVAVHDAEHHTVLPGLEVMMSSVLLARDWLLLPGQICRGECLEKCRGRRWWCPGLQPGMSAGRDCREPRTD